MKKVHCGWCGKTVRDKPLIGTLHLCVSDETKAGIMAIRAQREFLAKGPQELWGFNVVLTGSSEPVNPSEASGSVAKPALSVNE